MTTLYTAKLTDELRLYWRDSFNFETSLRKLNLVDQQKILRVKDETQRFKKLVQILLEKYVINSVLKRDTWQDLSFKYNKFGKPMIKGINFSISTSNLIVGIVVSDDLIGLDLSHNQQRIDPKTVLEDFKPIFSKGELEQFSNDNSKNTYILFNQFWTLKEAYTKLIGTGLNTDLTKIEFQIQEKISNSWLQVGNENYYCYSKIIDQLLEIPVIVSLVSQVQIEIGHHQVDFFDIIQTFCT